MVISRQATSKSTSVISHKWLLFEYLKKVIQFLGDYFHNIGVIKVVKVLKLSIRKDLDLVYLLRLCLTNI